MYAKNLVRYGGEIRDTRTPLDEDFNGAQITELFGKHRQGILLNTKVEGQRHWGEPMSARAVLAMGGIEKG